MHKGDSLKLENICKRYGSSTAVDNVSVQIEPGSFVSFLGPSGSGKTTTLMMVAGFETPTSGRILVGDKPVTGLPVHKRNIGVVFQSYALFPHLSVFENVAFALKMRGVSGAQLSSGVLDALSLVQLKGFERRMPHELSGGQQQRVALARAMVFRPGVVLMDEPLGALDKQLREHMQVELKRLQRSLGTTMVFVTHDQSEALTMSDSIVVMNNGKIEQVGSPSEIYEAPRTRFVASFIGESNFFDATVVDESPVGPVLDVAGLRIQAARQEFALRSKSVSLMIRPEKILALNDGQLADNEVFGVVEDSMYWGNVTKYRVRLNTATPVLVSVAVPRNASSPSFNDGDQIRLGWNARDSRVLDEDLSVPDALRTQEAKAPSTTPSNSVHSFSS